MTNQEGFKWLYISAIVLFILTGIPKIYTDFTHDDGPFVVTQQGVVTERELVAYPCGKNQSNTCKQYELTVNNVAVIVSEKTYLEAKVGQEITLGNTQRDNLSALSFMHMLFTVVMLLMLSLYIIITFIYWALCCSDDVPFKQYLKGLF